jgi:CRISPR-associated protein Csm2
MAETATNKALKNLESIITDGDSTQILVESANGIGKELVDARLTTSQIRAIFGEIRRIEGDWRPSSEGGKAEEEKNKERAKRANRSLILLKPKMAYRAQKERGKGVSDLEKILSPAIDYVNGNRDNFLRFVDFLEAILAYHKYHGGRD